MRLNDEKKSQIKIGDEIEFTNIKTNEKLICKVTNLFRYKDFDELYSNHNKISIFYDNSSWSYTKLGHINLSKSELTDLLDVDELLLH